MAKHILHVTHTDLDGIGCRELMRFYALAETASYTPIHIDYDNVTTTFFSSVFTQIRNGIYGDDVDFFVTDLGLTVEIADLIAKEIAQSGQNLKQFKLYDHHSTGSTAAAQHDWYYLDITISATRIVFEKLIADHPDQERVEPETRDIYDVFSTFVDAYDTYKRDNDALFQIGHFINSELQMRLAEIPMGLPELHSLRMDYAAYYIHELVNNCIYGFLDIYRTWDSTSYATECRLDSVVNSQQTGLLNVKRQFLVSQGITNRSSHQGLAECMTQVFNDENYLTLELDGHKLLVCWDIPGRILKPVFDILLYDQEKYSAYMIINSTQGNAGIYSRKGTLDVSRIAVSLGGGGHENACGCEHAALGLSGSDDATKVSYYGRLIPNMYRYDGVYTLLNRL